MPSTCKPTRETGMQRRWFHLRVWHGMTAGAWFGMLASNRWDVSPSRIYLVVLISAASLINSLLALVQVVIYGARIEATQLRDDPIFVLGHWRSGTTLLHELLTLDPTHHAPCTYACLAPSHFLVSQRLLSPLLRWLVPAKRSQDNVRLNLEGPQEDEWALCALGLPSPYQAAAFPNRLPHGAEYISLEALAVDKRLEWQSRWLGFLKAITLRQPARRLVLKSPLHTARIETLLQLFPNARFVHVERDPCDVFASTVRLWQCLGEDEGLGAADHAPFEEFVLDNYERMYRVFGRGRARIAGDRIHWVRYEELVASPLETLERVYAELGLGEFAAARAAVEDYVARMAQFKTNGLRCSSTQAVRVVQRWGDLLPKRRGAA